MQSLLIHGGRKLSGTVSVSGSKNAVLPMLAASVLFKQNCCIRRCPDLTDVDAAIEILQFLGADVRRLYDTVFVDSRPINRWDIPEKLMNRMRGSILFSGAILARFGKCRLLQPGGCPLGDRPIDFHAGGFRMLGAVPQSYDPRIIAGELTGGKVVLPYPSVGATENIILAALGANGFTEISNAAKEPEICCLCDFLRKGGCRIYGDGTSDIYIEGGLPDTAEHSVIPDRMEAATFACCVASAGGAVTIEKLVPEHLHPVLSTLTLAGCSVQKYKDHVFIEAKELLSPGDIVTGPYPDFPTDAQAPMMAALLLAQGNTKIQDHVFPHRMNHIPGLRRMGGMIFPEHGAMTVHGVSSLHGAQVDATDLRGGAALVIAGLAAAGETRVYGIDHILRGYENFAWKLRTIGADILQI